jgi:hypothetical protein
VLAYRQNVMADPDAYVGLAGSRDQSVTSILTWMGVGLTEYLAPFERDAAPVVESLTAVCAHFLREIPSVLDGLPPPPRLVL